MIARQISWIISCNDLLVGSTDTTFGFDTKFKARDVISASSDDVRDGAISKMPVKLSKKHAIVIFKVKGVNVKGLNHTYDVMWILQT